MEVESREELEVKTVLLEKLEEVSNLIPQGMEEWFLKQVKEYLNSRHNPPELETIARIIQGVPIEEEEIAYCKGDPF